MTLISAHSLRDKLHSDQSVIIDVREPWEYDEYNLGVKNIPLAELPHRLKDLEYCKNKEVIVHCKSGARSHLAMKYLTKQGFSNVKTVDGGIEAYLQTT